MANNQNEIYKTTLGGIEYSSSNAQPSHSAPKGSIHILKSYSAQEQHIFRNTADGNNWIEVSNDVFGDAYVTESTSTLTISATNTWYPISNAVTMAEGYLCNMRLDNGILYPTLPAYGGIFLATVTLTLDYVSGSDSYEVGLGYGSGDTFIGAGLRQTGSLQSLITYDCVSFTGVCQIYDTQGCQILVRNVRGTNNVQIRHAYLSLERIHESTLYE
jgi:hypothetical protein